jgi:hypothetical protein
VKEVAEEIAEEVVGAGDAGGLLLGEKLAINRRSGRMMREEDLKIRLRLYNLNTRILISVQ